MDEAVRRACAAVRELAMLPLERVEHPLATLVRDAGKPDVWDANHVCDVRARGEAEIDAVLAFADETLPAGVRHRDFRCDPETPPEFVARLLHEGFVATATVQMRLAGPITRATPAIDLRVAESEADWASLAAMEQASQREAAEREGRAPYAAGVSRGLVALRRASSPPVRMFLAEQGGRDVGHAGAFLGPDRIGVVEWVGVRPEARRRGLASALVAHAANDLRNRGAEIVLIGPLEGPYEAPRRCYARLGFRPWFATHRLLRA